MRNWVICCFRWFIIVSWFVKRIVLFLMRWWMVLFVSWFVDIFMYFSMVIFMVSLMWWSWLKWWLSSVGKNWRLRSVLLRLRSCSSCCCWMMFLLFCWCCYGWWSCRSVWCRLVLIGWKCCWWWIRFVRSWMKFSRWW